MWARTRRRCSWERGKRAVANASATYQGHGCPNPTGTYGVMIMNWALAAVARTVATTAAKENFIVGRVESVGEGKSRSGGGGWDDGSWGGETGKGPAIYCAEAIQIKINIRQPCRVNFMRRVPWLSFLPTSSILSLDTAATLLPCRRRRRRRALVDHIDSRRSTKARHSRRSAALMP